MVVNETINATANATNTIVNASENLQDIIGMDLGPLTDITFFGNSIWQYLLFFFAIIGAYLLGKLVSYLLKQKLAATAARTKT